jgi:hypothetical protein
MQVEQQDEHVYKMLVYRSVLGDCHVCIKSVASLHRCAVARRLALLRTPATPT